MLLLLLDDPIRLFPACFRDELGEVGEAVEVGEAGELPGELCDCCGEGGISVCKAFAGKYGEATESGGLREVEEPVGDIFVGANAENIF